MRNSIVLFGLLWSMSVCGSKQETHDPMIDHIKEITTSLQAVIKKMTEESDKKILYDVLDKIGAIQRAHKDLQTRCDELELAAKPPATNINTSSVAQKVGLVTLENLKKDSTPPAPSNTGSSPSTQNTQQSATSSGQNDDLAKMLEMLKASTPPAPQVTQPPAPVGIQPAPAEIKSPEVKKTLEITSELPSPASLATQALRVEPLLIAPVIPPSIPDATQEQPQVPTVDEQKATTPEPAAEQIPAVEVLPIPEVPQESAPEVGPSLEQTKTPEKPTDSVSSGEVDLPALPELPAV
ncbi:hypothetical protein FJ366_03595 [Candidatus Dependentiae bacterium]|nr:hypothetical protein [Candidatus Dependentiae bacterium]